MDDDSYNSGHGHAYEKYGIDPAKGAIVVVRPDQCKLNHPSLLIFRCLPSTSVQDVSLVSSLERLDTVREFFSRLFQGLDFL